MSMQDRWSPSTSSANLPEFDGLDDLEEALTEEEMEQEVGVVVPKGELGDGLTRLSDYLATYRETGEEPDMSEEDFRELHVSIIRDLHASPELSTWTWVAKALDETDLVDDPTYEVIEAELIKRADELDTQATMDAIISFGNIFWVGKPLLKTLATTTRRLLKSFTNIEVVRVTNGLLRMGAIDTTEHAGLLFEINKRVHHEGISKFFSDTLGRDGRFFAQEAKEMKDIAGLFNMPENGRLKGEVETYLAKEISDYKQRQLQAIQMAPLLAPAWDPEGEDAFLFDIMKESQEADSRLLEDSSERESD